MRYVPRQAIAPSLTIEDTGGVVAVAVGPDSDHDLYTVTLDSGQVLPLSVGCPAVLPSRSARLVVTGMRRGVRYGSLMLATCASELPALPFDRSPWVRRPASLGDAVQPSTPYRVTLTAADGEETLEISVPMAGRRHASAWISVPDGDDPHSVSYLLSLIRREIDSPDSLDQTIDLKDEYTAIAAGTTVGIEIGGTNEAELADSLLISLAGNGDGSEDTEVTVSVEVI